MALPDGIALVTVTIGPPLDFNGDVIPGGSVTIKPSNSIVHAASGTPIIARPQKVPLDEDGLATVQLPATDQDGFTDGQGNPIVNWSYGVTWAFKDRTVPNRPTVNVALPAVAPTVDLDLLTPVDAGKGTTLLLPSLVPWGTTPPNPAAIPVYIDTTSLPPTLKGWNGTAWVAIGTGTAGTGGTGTGGGTTTPPGFTATDAGNGLTTVTPKGSATAVDNGNGLVTLTGGTATDAGNGLVTIA